MFKSTSSLLKPFRRTIVLLLALGLHVIVASGCREGGGGLPPVAAPTDIAPSPVAVIPDEEPLPPEEYERLWSGKKKLIWLFDSELVYSSARSVMTEFNETLLANGAEFVVEFVHADVEGVEAYYELIRSMKREGAQVDLLNTGSGSGEVAISTYPAAAADGLLEPLDSYLQTAEGRRLYESILPSSWETVEIDQNIYGIHPMPTAVANLYLFINEKVRDQMGIEIPESLAGLADLENALRSATEKGKDNPLFVPLYVWVDSAKALTEYDYLDSGIAVRRSEAGVPEAFNPLANEEVREMLKAMSDFKTRGYLKEGQAIEEVIKGNFLAFVSYAYPHTYHAGRLQIDINDPVIEVDARLYRNGLNIKAVNGINGVASWSENKAEAMQLLTMIHTNAELSNLLRHGFKSPVADMPIKDTQEVYRGIASPANNIITVPIGLETDNKPEQYRQYAAGFAMSPAAGFVPDEINIAEELATIGQVYRKYESLWTGSDDAAALIDQANRELQEAQLDRVIAELNRQLEQWHRSELDSKVW